MFWNTDMLLLLCFIVHGTDTTSSSVVRHELKIILVADCASKHSPLTYSNKFSSLKSTWQKYQEDHFDTKRSTAAGNWATVNPTRNRNTCTSMYVLCVYMYFSVLAKMHHYKKKRSTVNTAFRELRCIHEIAAVTEETLKGRTNVIITHIATKSESRNLKLMSQQLA